MGSVKIDQPLTKLPQCHNRNEEDGTSKYPTMYTGPLDTATEELARKELRETPENVEKGLRELKALLENDPEMHFDTSDDFLLIFLRPCKFYAESAYALMKRIAEFKRKNHHIFENLLPEDVIPLMLQYNVAGCLEQRDHKNRRVMIEYLGAPWNPSKLAPEDLFKIVYLVSELAVVEQETQVRGCVVIMDYHGLALKHLKAMTPGTCARLMELIQDALPLRLKEVHVVRQPSFFKPIWILMKPFIGEKMKKRLFFHGYKMASLHQYIPPSHLPKDYGGDLPALTDQGKMWAHLFNENLIHMKRMNACGFVKKS